MTRVTLLICLLLFYSGLVGQTEALTDSLRPKQFTSPSILSSVSSTFNEVSKVPGALSKYTNAVDSNLLKISFRGNIFSEVSYVLNSTLPPDNNGVYGRTGLSGQLKLGSLPFDAGITVNYRNNRVWADYTIMNFNFDTKGFVSGLKNNYLKYLSDIDNFYPSDLSKQLNSYQDSLQKLEALDKQLNSSSYYSKLRDYQSAQRILEDSVILNKADSCTVEDYSRICDSIAHYKSLSNQYASLDSFRAQNTHLQKYLDKYTGYVDSIKNAKDLLSMPDINTALEKAGIMDKAGSIFGGIQKLGIGRVNINLSEFTSRSQSVYGFQFDYLYKKLLYAGVGLGMASPNNFQFNPTLNNLQQPIRFNFHRWLGYFRIGIGKPEDSHLHLIYLSYGDKFTTTGNNLTSNQFAPAPANSVLALAFKKLFKEPIAIEGEIASSNSSFSQRNATFLPFNLASKKNAINFAARTSVSASIKKTLTRLNLKGLVVSRDFRSAGILFQRSDFAEYAIGIQQSVPGNIVNFSSLFTQNFSGIFSGNMPVSFLTVTSSASAAPASFMQLNVLHTYIKQTGATSTRMNSHNLSLTQTYTYGKERCKGVSSVTLTYNLMESKVSEQPSRRNTLQANLNQIVNLNKGISINGGAGCSIFKDLTENIKPTYWIESGSQFRIKQKCDISYNLRYLHDASGLSNVMCSAGLNAQLYKGLSLRISEQFMYMAGGLKQLNNQTTASLSYSFDYKPKVRKNNAKNSIKLNDQADSNESDKPYMRPVRF